MYLAESVSDLVDVEIADMRVGAESFLQRLERSAPDILGISCLTYQLPVVHRMARDAKSWNPELKVVVGGRQATLEPSSFDLSFFDAVIGGDGSEKFRQLLEGLTTPGRSFTDEVVEGLKGPPARRRYPLRSRFDLPYDSYQFGPFGRMGLVQTSSGCPHSCSFCDVVVVSHRRYVSNRVDDVINDIVDNDAGSILFADDESFIGHGAMMDMGQRLMNSEISRRYFAIARAATVARSTKLLEVWKMAGLYGVFMGIDSIRQAVLDQYGKRTKLQHTSEAIHMLKSLEISIFGNFIVDPSWSHSEFVYLEDAVTELGIEYPSFSIMTTLPGTQGWGSVETGKYALMDLSHDVERRATSHTFEEDWLRLKQFAYEVSQNSVQRSGF